MEAYEHLWRLVPPALIALIPSVIALARCEYSLALGLALGGPLLVVAVPYLALVGITFAVLAGSVDREVAVGAVRSLPAWPWLISGAFAIFGTLAPFALKLRRT